ncbi:tetratricopeptide repeat protein [uncultured Paraglaciecola sp.]|uniref:tetratricopeptide repeat protein n=1 Tax=uncultured Paraglaciecola sp. TaxID=1765024 RepID=UPI0030DCBC24|tara:strand:+ start:61518 stop:62840 length:1323 start_codon:yes stop_codon:yes gene_type:complete
MAMNKLLLKLAAPVLMTSVLLTSIQLGVVYAEEAKVERKTQRVPTLRSKVYDQLSRAQSLADAGNPAEAFEVLDNVKSKASSMNSYEQAMMYNFYGFIHYEAENYDQAIAAFENVVQQQPIPETFEQATLFSLAQLHMMRGNYDKTIAKIEQWEAIQKNLYPNKEIPAKNLVLKAQAMYQKQDYASASQYINAAVEQIETNDLGFQVDEQWYVLQRAIYFELKQPENVKNVLLKLVKKFEAPKYWIQLAGMYGELEQEEKQLAIMEIAEQKSYIATGSDMFNLAQLYYYHQLPFKAAAVMQKAIDAGKLPEDERNLTFLAQSWNAAKETEKAIPVMLAAAKLSDTGELYAQLGQMYLNMDKWSQAIAASEQAIEKGGLRNEGMSHLVIGMAQFNVGEYNEALSQLAKAQEYPGSRGMAQQWSKFVEGERKQFANYASIGS